MSTDFTTDNIFVYDNSVMITLSNGDEVTGTGSTRQQALKEAIRVAVLKGWTWVRRSDERFRNMQFRVEVTESDKSNVIDALNVCGFHFILSTRLNGVYHVDFSVDEYVTEQEVDMWLLAHLPNNAAVPGARLCSIRYKDKSVENIKDMECHYTFTETPEGLYYWYVFGAEQNTVRLDVTVVGKNGMPLFSQSKSMVTYDIPAAHRSLLADMSVLLQSRGYSAASKCLSDA